MEIAKYTTKEGNIHFFVSLDGILFMGINREVTKEDKEGVEKLFQDQGKMRVTRDNIRRLETLGKLEFKGLD